MTKVIRIYDQSDHIWPKWSNLWPKWSNLWPKWSKLAQWNICPKWSKIYAQSDPFTFCSCDLQDIPEPITPRAVFRCLFPEYTHWLLITIMLANPFEFLISRLSMFFDLVAVRSMFELEAMYNWEISPKSAEVRSCFGDTKSYWSPKEVNNPEAKLHWHKLPEISHIVQWIFAPYGESLYVCC